MLFKIIKYTLIFGVAVIALLFGASFITGYVVGRDIETISFHDIDKSNDKSLTAKRDHEGIWEINAPNRDALWYSFGFVQAHDRYFQAELIRHAALGRLAELMGEEVVGRDRLMRVMAAIAYREFQKKPRDSEVYKSAQRFVDGIKAWRHSEYQKNPVEFRVLGLKLADMPEWEPWHVYAISYYQAWLFSYDLADELRDHELTRIKGKAWVNFFDSKEIGGDEFSIYAQETVRGHLQKPKGGYAVTKYLRAMMLPREVEDLDKLYGITKVAQKSASVGRTPQELKLGASNAWIGYNPSRKLGPILCNDPHLGLMWPSSLYPIKYRLHESRLNDIKSAGWMLPGQPFMVMGGIEDAKRMYAWGITLANYANVQDVVPLDVRDMAQASKFESKIRVRDPRTFKDKVLSFDEHWTQWGPVASDWFDHGNVEASKKEPEWAIDWIGFRGAEPPYEYFITQNFNPALDTAETISATWQTPVVNLHWISKDKEHAESSWGHIVTGMIFSHDGKQSGLSTAKDRLYYSSNTQTQNGLAFLASANQQIWDNKTSKPLSNQWGSPLRGQRILEKKEDNFKSLGFSQVDDHSTLFLSYVKWARRRLDVSRLCSDGAAEFVSRCQQDLSGIDAWTGSMDQNDWRPSVVALWVAQLKWRFWIQKNASSRGAELTSRSDREIKSFIQWSKSGAAQKLIWDVAHNPAFASELKKEFHLDLDALVQASFSEAYTLLENSMGPDRSMWNWANLHRVAWQHPLLRVLGANLPFIGPPVSGADDAPRRASSEWDPRFPLLFPVVHGAVQRSCYDSSGDHLGMQWTAVSGPSGNPFSKWSETFSKEYYFAGKWVEENFFKQKK